MIKFPENIDIKDYTLILPAVAVGNVAQLAVDLLIYNSGMKKIGQLLSPDFIPFCGANPYDKNSSEICTTADFYIHEDKRLIVLQIRSPPLTKLVDVFNELRDFIKARSISKVIILTSQWQFVRVDRQLSSNEPMRYVVSPSLELESGKTFEELGWKKLEITNTNDTPLAIRGGGCAPSLFKFLSKENIACALLFRFSSEGNNSPDAKEFARFLNQWISLLPESNKDTCWKEPPSWQHIFGPDAPVEIY
ncbi:proteasome assembly chaperone 2 [Venturia canescens]|uniref:proteasome assembly chaperone 2 n=1 Tax=Venturia canescens TaxID=32260 RepID=UPI001C9CC578|nr:proteasome assembly chaperone 2 [Venturia canescens]